MKVRQMARCALFAALITLCAWLSIAAPGVRFTLQTFGIALCLLTLGGQWGMAAVGLYLLLGLVGLPVFSGFRGGVAALLDPTGGFLWGFFLGAAVYRLLERFGKVLALGAMMVVCYLSGCVWFCLYFPEVGLAAGFLSCVVPYLIPDGGKLWLAWLLAGRLKRHM